MKKDLRYERRAVAALVFVVALGVSAVAIAARPGNEFLLETQLHGQNTRWTMADGGKSGVFTEAPDGGALNPSCSCILINNAKSPQNLPLLGDGGLAPAADGGAPTPVYTSFSANVLYLWSFTAAHVCIRPSAASPVWDGGCNVSVRDENFGDPLPANTGRYVVPDQRATTLCACSDAGYLQLPIWAAQ